MYFALWSTVFQVPQMVYGLSCLVTWQQLPQSIYAVDLWLVVFQVLVYHILSHKHVFVGLFGGIIPQNLQSTLS
jgi:hypothetical protein